jgi:hypothetical protein
LGFFLLKFHNDRAAVTTRMAKVFRRGQPIVHAVGQTNLRTTTPRTIHSRQFSMSETPKYFTYIPQQSHVCQHLLSIQLLELYIFVRISKLEQKLANLLAMISLEHYLPVLGGSSTCTEAFQFLSNSRQIRILVVDTIDNR